MQENLEINLDESSDLIPVVNFEVNTGRCSISGYSSPENPLVFYTALTKWLDDYFKQKPTIVFDFKLEYFNTASSKGILGVIQKLKEYQLTGGQVKANWYYEEDDLDMYEEGEDYVKDTELELNFITY